jgi:hypothetical protein
VRSNAELRRLLALPGATAVESLLHLQRSAGNSAASGLIRLLLSGKGPAATSDVEGGLALHGSTTASYTRTTTRAGSAPTTAAPSSRSTSPDVAQPICVPE